MSVASSAQYSPARTASTQEPTEPFGQAGVSQYAGRIIAWMCITVALCALAMGRRSTGFNDVLEWHGRSQVVDLISGEGQLLLGNSTFEHRTFTDTGWKYAGSYDHWWSRHARMPQRAWGVPGLEGGNTPQIAGADTGFWLRVSWPLVAAVFMIQPIAWLTRRLVARLPKRHAA